MLSYAGHDMRVEPLRFGADPDVELLLGIALLVAFVGAGLLTAAKFLERANREDTTDISSTFR